MMKAVVQTAYGDPAKVLKVMEVPLPKFDPTSSKVLVRVHAVSLNPLDYAGVIGRLRIIGDKPIPQLMGAEASGIVVKAGKDSGFNEGDEVYGGCSIQDMATLAEYVLLPSDHLAPKPKSLSHEEAACLPVAGITCIQTFQRHNGPRDIAFIPGGMGGVGHLALQLAKPYAGFKHTITTVSTSKVALVKEHIKDVDEVIDYKKVDPASVIPAHSVDFVFEQFGKPTTYVRYMKKPAPGTPGKPSIISIFTPPSAAKCEEGWETKLPWYLAIILNIMDWYRRLWIPSWLHYDSFFALSSREDMEVLTKFADEGKLKPVIVKTFPMEQIVEAMALTESKPAGKVVVRCIELLLPVSYCY
ncbi:GroES-like protein [Dacryopinax primogenitus]|uniref:GroES-like protein n=1 Tax=Dacryopinax primogenitus (strain DJM 731) TaxID=1858805 RepID=M5GEC7_DACPD|nr:GroES-like protein [Dacryopinax primogenitus]EJU05297.1 GroES-like protein [Dacryopinax primogenitus]